MRRSTTLEARRRMTRRPSKRPSKQRAGRGVRGGPVLQVKAQSEVRSASRLRRQRGIRWPRSVARQWSMAASC